jgi:phosphoribosylanthranilate isomerase
MKESTKIKICGITRRKDLYNAIDAGANAIGLVVGVPSSPRNISLGKAQELVSQISNFTKSVLVMVPKNIQEIKEAYDIVKPDAIQIHNNLINADMIRTKKIETNLIRAINLKPKGSIESSLIQGFDAILLDTYIPGKYGGTGITQNWEFCSGIRRSIHPKKVILAGGLTPSNIQKAIKTVEPYGVDVSTGVESSPGIKDPRKIKSFINQVRELEI